MTIFAPADETLNTSTAFLHSLDNSIPEKLSMSCDRIEELFTSTYLNARIREKVNNKLNWGNKFYRQSRHVM
jgi:hypothetical protein